MTEDVRMAWIVCIGVVLSLLVIGLTIVISTKINNDRLGPAQRHQFEKQVEAVRACEKSSDVNSCIRLALGRP